MYINVSICSVYRRPIKALAYRKGFAIEFALREYK